MSVETAVSKEEINMSKNYTNYSKIVKDETPEATSESVANNSSFNEDAVEAFVGESKEIFSENKVENNTTGIVVDCEKLNIRNKPNMNGEIICVVAKGSIVVIYETESTDEWYKVCAENGAEGFCMRKFIKVKSL